MDVWARLADELGYRGAPGDYLGALEALVPALYGEDPDRRVRGGSLRDAVLDELCRAMRVATHPPRRPVRFGTSGWRGLLYEDFTLHTVGCVTEGLVEALLDPATHAALGVESVEELRARGAVLAHDTRLMGPEFVEVAARVLLAHGIPVVDLGLATTPEVSAALAETGAAFSINFTPSHNPFTYHGYKFNPADGGPATRELTDPVAARAAAVLARGSYRALDPGAWVAARRDPLRYRREDPVALYRRCLRRRLPWLDPDRLVDRLNAADVELYADHGFGATRGKYQRLLPGLAPGKLHGVHDADDPLLGGRSREPSVEHFRELQARMRASRARLVVGFMNDGDGDRFLGGGRKAVLPMNRLGPLVVRYLVQEVGLRGDVARSVMTSHMADAARARYLPEGRLHETPVGFQHLKAFVPVSVNAWEESDGMSPQGWLRDKDGLVAALLLTAMVLHYDRPPEALLEELEAELGWFAFERRAVAVRQQGEVLAAALAARFGALAPEQTVRIAGRTFRVARVVTLDGTKVVFDEGWWFGVRPSGTEPVVRVYVETCVPPGAGAADRAAAAEWQRRILDWLVAEVRAATGGA